MKVNITLRIAIISFFILSGFISLAQVPVRDTLPPVIITSSASVTKKVNDAFTRDFKNAIDAKWIAIDKNYLVKFITADQNNAALYDKRGYQIYHISYGTEKHLPQRIKNQLMNQYKNGRITSVFNVNQDRRNIWIANIEDGNAYVIARVEDGELEEVERFEN